MSSINFLYYILYFYSSLTLTEMKNFKFNQVDKRLNKKSQKEVKQQKMRQNFLKLYDQIPSDPKMQKYCQATIQDFNQRRQNNRYYSYDLQKSPQKQQQLPYIGKQQIKKLLNYQMPYKEISANTQSENQLENKSEVQEKQIKVAKRKQQLKKKFRMEMKIIIYKIKKAKLSVEQIMSKNIFSKQTYKFGRQIFTSIKQANVEKVWRILLQNKYSIYSVDNTEKTPLFWCCIRDQPKILKLIIDAGANLNQKDIYGLTALNYAIRYNSAECVKLLMIQLANIDKITQSEISNASELVRNIFNVGVGNRRMFKKLDFQKRVEFFNEQYDYLYKRKD